MSKYKIVIFDLDGTLINSLTDLANSANCALSLVGLPTHPIDAYKTFVGNGREMLIKRAMGDKFQDESLFNTVMEKFNLEYKLHSNDNTCAYSGCDVLLNRLSENNIMTAVLSNKPHEFVKDILDKVYPNHVFTVAWGKQQTMPPKPDKTSLLKLLADLNLSPSDCLYIGDSDVDVFTAENAGVDMLGVSWGFRGREELLSVGAEYVVDNAEDILRYVL